MRVGPFGLAVEPLTRELAGQLEVEHHLWRGGELGCA